MIRLVFVSLACFAIGALFAMMWAAYDLHPPGAEGVRRGGVRTLGYRCPGRASASEGGARMTTPTGWPPGLLQDDSKGLSRWLASRPDARRIVREVCAEIRPAAAYIQDHKTGEAHLVPIQVADIK